MTTAKADSVRCIIVNGKCNGKEHSFDVVTDMCVKYFNGTDITNPCEMAISIMRTSGFPMHNFVHHYLVPAVLLTAACKAKVTEYGEYAGKLVEIKKRAKSVLPGFCGFYGACGAAVGLGIFLSVFTDTTPLVKETWGLCNMGTAKALERMAETGGPRCCKRSTFIALSQGTELIREHFGLDLGICNVKCLFSEMNAECLQQECPFHVGAF